MKRAIAIALAVMAFTTIKAQTFSFIPQTETSSKTFDTSSKYEGGITLGTTGIGLEVTRHINEDWDVRAGFDFYPHINNDMHFKVRVGDELATEAENKSKFDRMASTLKDFTGYTVDDEIKMKGKPTMWNFKLLVDFKPFVNKRWHVTAGFYLGNSKIASAENATEDMTSLTAVGLYNHMYELAENGSPYATLDGTDLYLPREITERLLNNGRMGVHVGTYKRDIYYKQDVYYQDGEIGDDGNIHTADEIKHKAGVDIEHHKGDAYNMEPNADGMVKASVKVNRFKPYLGFGYMGKLTDKDPRLKVGFDAGIAFWGGTPSMKTHDGTDLIKDVTDLKHGVKKYRNLFNAMKVLPVINFRITRTF